ncbi:MAG TPA: hypothetical protein VJB59_09325 [Bdellovibrionota bacterium]|nr:hypothetical protein [Bdellovibrionota bacterium]
MEVSLILWSLVALVLTGCTEKLPKSPNPADSTPKNAAGTAATAVATKRTGGTPVLQHQNSAARDGLYVDPILNRNTVSALRLDPTFVAKLDGTVYAQPLYFPSAQTPGGLRDLIIISTEQNLVQAVEANSGANVWSQKLGPPVPRSHLPCGNIDPVGITGTPIIDPESRTLFVNAMTTPDGGVTKKHLIFAISVDDGSIRSGWPVDVGANARFKRFGFDPSVQNQQGALALVGDTLCVPYTGHHGECGNFHGWVVTVSISDPAIVKSWATRVRGGGVWAPAGITSDGTSAFIATGSTFGVSAWNDGQAILRLDTNAAFKRNRTNFFTPKNWRSLDTRDRGLGGTAPTPIDIPNSNPSELLISIGKNGVAYLVNRDKLGGVGKQVFAKRVTTSPAITATAKYNSSYGSYLVFNGRGIGCPGEQSGDLTAIRVSPGTPPKVRIAWCANQNGLGSPIVSSPDGKSNAIVWAVGPAGEAPPGKEAEQQLKAFDGETGEVLFAGGGPADRIFGVQSHQNPIIVNGRIYVVGNDRLFAFSLAP